MLHLACSALDFLCNFIDSPYNVLWVLSNISSEAIIEERNVSEVPLVLECPTMSFHIICKQRRLNEDVITFKIAFISLLLEKSYDSI